MLFRCLSFKYGTLIAFMQGKVQDKVKDQIQFHNLPSPKQEETLTWQKKTGNTTDGEDLWALKERVQSSVEGKDLSLWFMRHEDLSSAGVLYIFFSFTLHGKSNNLPRCRT